MMLPTERGIALMLGGFVLGVVAAVLAGVQAGPWSLAIGATLGVGNLYFGLRPERRGEVR